MRITANGKTIATQTPFNSIRYMDLQNGSIFIPTTGKNISQVFIRESENYQINLITGQRISDDEMFGNPVVEFYPDAVIELGTRQELKPQVITRSVLITLDEAGDIDTTQKMASAKKQPTAKK